MSQLAEQLHKAADIIATQGWRQYGGMNPDGGEKCLMGALAQALDAKVLDMEEYGFGHIYSYAAVERTPAYLAVEEQIGAEATAGPWLSSWNDADGRTAEDVIGVLRAAAVIEEARASERTPVPVTR